MAPRGTIPQRAAANCRLTRPISTMADAVPSPVSAAACSGRHQCAPRAAGGHHPVKKTGRSAVCHHRHRGCPTHAIPRQLKG